ncbi:MAG: hypothetical protein Q4G69_08770 [Planctomycetia bacterium]|nr:hypothetical protein [Planctomycetia bacterium]
MSKKFLLLCLFFAFSFVFPNPFSVFSEESPQGSPEEIPCRSKVLSVKVFKNGIFAVCEEIPVPRPGKYLLLDPPVPVHGTFFAESTCDVLIRSVLRDRAVPLDQIESMDRIRDFAGKKVRITLAGANGKEECIEAEILSPGSNYSAPGSLFSSRRIPSYSGYGSSYAESAPSPFLMNQGPLLLRQLTGDRKTIMIWNLNKIEKIEFLEKDALDTLVRSRPALLFDVHSGKEEDANDSKEKKIFLTSLSKGISWSPSYRIDISDPKKLSIEQAALIVNEWRDLADTDFELISGYPQILFKNAVSPIDRNTSLANFFSSLSRSSDQDSRISMQQAVMGNAWRPSESNSFADANEISDDSIDTFFQKIGKRSIQKGDRLQISIDKKEIEWNKLVCWNIEDNRDPEGRVVSREEYARNRRESNYGSTFSGTENSVFQQYLEPWDIIRFRNPFDFPISTGPATIMKKDRFLGQTMIYWVNSGEETAVGINKALSIRVSSREEERPQGEGEKKESAASIGYPNAFGSSQSDLSAPILPPGISRDQISANGKEHRILVHGRQYRIAVIDAKLTITNQRSEEISMVIHRRFSGEILPVSEKEKGNRPKDVLCSDSRNGINRRHELTWEVQIGAGKTKEIPFSYQVLIAL